MLYNKQEKKHMDCDKRIGVKKLKQLYLTSKMPVGTNKFHNIIFDLYKMKLVNM